MKKILAIFLALLCQCSTGNADVFGQYDVIGKATNDGTSRFFIVGDWGGLPTSPFDTPSEVAIAGAMGQMGVQLNTTFQLALGDNFYFDGVQSVNDSRFQVAFFSLVETTSE
jgi:hypothetical protein